VSLRLLPFLFLLYVVNILDRVNVGFARLQMLSAIGLEGKYGEAVFGLGTGIFYLGYLIFEVPSNLILHRMGARLWIGRIMISWGIISTAMLFVRGEWSFYILRFLLGVAEAGFFPGIILYLSYWYPARERARAVALFMIASPIAGVVGNPISGALLQYMNGTAGMAGWQWLFLVEGLPSVVLGVVVWFYLPDSPEQARWLTAAERELLLARLRTESIRRAMHHGGTRWQAMFDRRVWLLIALYFTVAVGSNSFGFYSPTILQGQFSVPDRAALATNTWSTAANAQCRQSLAMGPVPYLLEVAASTSVAGASERGTLRLGFLAAIPSLAAVIAMVVMGTHSDRTGERRWHVATSALIGGVGWGIAAWGLGLPEPEVSPWVVLAGLTVAQLGMLSMLPTFWALPTAFLGGTAAAGGIALINSVANLGGFLGPNIIAQLKGATGDFTSGMIVMALTMFVGACLALCVKHDPKLERYGA
jgi:MFS family permease